MYHDTFVSVVSAGRPLRVSKWKTKMNDVKIIRTKLFNNLVDDDDDDDDTSATAHQIGELCVWRGERAYRPNDANNFNEAEIEVLIEYLCTS